MSDFEYQEELRAIDRRVAPSADSKRRIAQAMLTAFDEDDLTLSSEASPPPGQEIELDLETRGAERRRGQRRQRRQNLAAIAAACLVAVLALALLRGTDAFRIDSAGPPVEQDGTPSTNATTAASDDVASIGAWCAESLGPVTEAHDRWSAPSAATRENRTLLIEELERALQSLEQRLAQRDASNDVAVLEQRMADIRLAAAVGETDVDAQIWSALDDLGALLQRESEASQACELPQK